MRLYSIIYPLLVLLEKPAKQNGFPKGEEVAKLFNPFRSGLAGFLEVLLIIIGVITLGVATYHVIQGDRDAAKKYFIWVFVMALGFIMLNVIAAL